MKIQTNVKAGLTVDVVTKSNTEVKTTSETSIKIVV